MKQLNGDLLIEYITVKLSKYEKRRAEAKMRNDVMAIKDYDIRMMPLYNLLIRIDRGEFDILSSPDSINKSIKKMQENE